VRIFVLSLAIAWLIAAPALASDACKSPAACAEAQTRGSPDQCGHCGRHCGCEKHCRVVRETKEVKKHVWVVKCSDFCAPLPNCGRSCGGCGNCEACAAEAARGEGCDKKCDPCARENDKCLVPPKCGKVREKKTLEKKEITCKVPSYKCVVVYACSRCGARECGDDKATPAAPAPGETTQDPPLPPVVGASFVK